MKIAIMQPYIFPYIGYFQLINCADQFVIYDDVQYMKGGWINRNRILMNNRELLFTFSVNSGSLHDKISSRQFARAFPHERNKFMKQLHAAYSKAPHFLETMSLIESIFSYDENRVSLFITNQLKLLCAHIGIETTIVLSSDIPKDDSLKAEERVIDICRRLGGSLYINSIGGRELYSRASFERKGLQLQFIQSKLPSYPQFGSEFIPALSIIDVLMFNSRDEVRTMLGEYILL